MMNKIFTLLAIMVLGCMSVSAYSLDKTSFSNEDLKYVITYKWGVVHKDAGTATLSLRNRGNNYVVTLTARTKPWADKIFMVRDTLTARISKSGFRPSLYVKTSHEGGKYAKDIINYSYSGRNITGKTTKIREKKGKRTQSGTTLTSTGPTYDMLSIFYYLRCIDYASIAKGHMVRATVFSGSKSETITIKPIGIETIKLRNKQSVKAFHLRFNFTTKGKKKSSDDMNVWISDDSRHIPLLLVGNLPVGQVKCYFIG